MDGRFRAVSLPVDVWLPNELRCELHTIAPARTPSTALSHCTCTCVHSTLLQFGFDLSRLILSALFLFLFLA